MSFVRWRRKRITRFKRSPLRFVAESVFIPFFFLGPLLYPANNALTVSEYDVASGRLPDAFDGYVVVQVSDLHCKEFGPRNDRLIAAIEREKPDLIVVTAISSIADISNSTPFGPHNPARGARARLLCRRQP